MNEKDEVIGYIIPTTPPSSPLDTLKALVHRNVESLDYIADQLCGSDWDVPEEMLDYIDHVRKEQLRALGEHIHVARDDQLLELRHIHPDGYVYDDGSPVFEHWHEQGGATDYYPRYDGDRDENYQQFKEWAARNRRDAETDQKFGEIIDGIEWGNK